MSRSARAVAICHFSTVFGGAGATSPGLIIGPGSKSTFTEFGNVSLQGDLISKHGPGLHNAATVLIGSANTFSMGVAILAAVSGAEEKPIARVGDPCSCGCIIVNGEPSLFN
jgi:uncharacterized Zn-binding protein involved in type VI secretion